MTVSLKSEILERLHLKHGANYASSNIRKASHDFAGSDAPQFRGKSKKKRHQMAVAAGLHAARESVLPKVGDRVGYQGKQVLVQSINESAGMAVVKVPRLRDPKIVRICDLASKTALTEGVIGLAAIAPTYRDTGVSQFIRTDLSLEDIGLDIIGLREDEDTGERDEQEEDSDNGSNIRHDGHTGKKEVDELPTPSDTIATAYSDDKPPKQISKPLSTEPGYTVAEDPDFDGYDYPADAPEIPKADFEGQDAGNTRQPRWDGHFEKSHLEHIDGDGDERTDEGFRFVTEMDDMLGHDDHEPREGETITVTLPAMASILCTVAHRMGADVQQGGHDETMLRSMIEALAEVGRGSGSGAIDVPDLEAVASHMNGEESHEMDSAPPHMGTAMGDNGNHSDGGPDDHEHEPSDSWPGDGDKTKNGKTKLMGGGISEMSQHLDFYGVEDILAEERKLSEEEELRLMKRRAGLKFW